MRCLEREEIVCQKGAQVFGGSLNLSEFCAAATARRRGSLWTRRERKRDRFVFGQSPAFGAQPIEFLRVQCRRNDGVRHVEETARRRHGNQRLCALLDIANE